MIIYHRLTLSAAVFSCLLLREINSLCFHDPAVWDDLSRGICCQICSRPSRLFLRMFLPQICGCSHGSQPALQRKNCLFPDATTSCSFTGCPIDSKSAILTPPSFCTLPSSVSTEVWFILVLFWVVFPPWSTWKQVSFILNLPWLNSN